METRCSFLTAEKINLASDKNGLEDLVKQQQNALKKSYAQYVHQ